MSNHSIRVGSWALLLFVASACNGRDPSVHSLPECNADSDCGATTAACVQLACVSGQCQPRPSAEGAPCDDGLFCTAGESCDGKGTCSGGHSPCYEIAPGLPRCNEAELKCDICSNGIPLIDGQCRCPFWYCTARGGAAYCAEQDVSEPNNVSCFYDGATVD